MSGFGGFMAIVVNLVLLAVGLLALYFVVKAAVRAGILAAMKNPKASSHLSRLAAGITRTPPRQ